MKHVLITSGVGLGAGFLSGLLGVGGGVLIVPALVLLLDMSQRGAQATSLAVIVPAALAGCIRYHFLEHSVDWRLAAGVAVGAVIGASGLGVPLAHRLGDETLKRLFGLLMIAVGLRMTGLTQIVVDKLGRWLGG